MLSYRQARISQIEHGQVNGLDLLRSYTSAIGGVLQLQIVRGPMSVTLVFPGDASGGAGGAHDAA